MLIVTFFFPAFNFTFDTFFGTTVIVALAYFLLPSFAVAVIVTFPTFLAVTFPFDDTVATFVFELFHVTLLLVAFFGLAVAFSV